MLLLPPHATSERAVKGEPPPARHRGLGGARCGPSAGGGGGGGRCAGLGAAPGPVVAAQPARAAPAPPRVGSVGPQPRGLARLCRTAVTARGAGGGEPLPPLLLLLGVGLAPPVLRRKLAVVYFLPYQGLTGRR